MGVREIAGYYGELHAGLEELGYDAVLVSLFPHPFYGTVLRGRVPTVARLAAMAAEHDARSAGRPLPTRVWWRLAARCLRLPLFAWALATRDIFVFGFGSSILGHPELRLLKLAGRRVVYVFHGSDSRPPYLDGALTRPELGFDADAVIELTRQQKHRLRTIERWADLVVANPLSAHLHERPIVSSPALGRPRPALPAAALRVRRDAVRALHSPSDPGAKGSRAIRALVERLRADGLALEFVELSGVPHKCVLEALRDVDFVIDQLYSDLVLPAFSAEAAAAGVPALIGGYGVDEIEPALCGRPFPPVLFCHPDEFETMLVRLATDEQLRRELGAAARRFVERELAPPAMAQRLLDAIAGRKPEWTYDPQGITYLHGVGLSEPEARALVRATIEQGGVEALCVGDKPALEARLVEFAGFDPDRAVARSGAGGPPR